MRTADLRPMIGAGLILESFQAELSEIVTPDVKSRRGERPELEKSKVEKSHDHRGRGGRGSHAKNEKCACRSIGLVMRAITSSRRLYKYALCRDADRLPLKGDWIQRDYTPARRLSRNLSNVDDELWLGFCIVAE